jgi:O-6-methylguanine DNA methyltransferase
VTLELTRELRALGRVRAPATLHPAVMERVGAGDAYVRLDSPIGQVFVAWNPDGISAVTRTDSESDFVLSFGLRTGRPLRRAAELPPRLARSLAAELSGEGRPRFRFDLRDLTEFEQAVLAKTLEIPRGEVRTYGWVAREIGRPKAVRAVGTALANNPVPLLIPCHRVVRSDGVIGNYGAGGPAAKRAILRHEGLDTDELERMWRSGWRYEGSRTTHIFCFPTCRHARRVGDAHRVVFHSEAEAVAAGYRACKICRPALTA